MIKFKPGDLVKTNSVIYDFLGDATPMGTIGLILEPVTERKIDYYDVNCMLVWYKVLINEKKMTLWEKWLEELNEQI